MKNLSSIIKYGLIGLIVIALGLWIYIESHQPQLKGKVTLHDNTEEVSVYYDDFGIPHIYAKNSGDAYRTLGYVHAQDRLFQMELMRRVGAGRLAEIFGEELMEADMWFRTIGTHTKAKADAAQFSKLPPHIQTVIEAYLAGINTYIEQGKIPLEYKILGLDPEPFTITDMYCVSGYMAYSFAYAMRTDPLVEHMKNTLDLDYLIDLDLGYQAEVDSNAFQGRDTLGVNLDSTFAAINRITVPEILDHLPTPLMEGSNSWAVSPARSLSGKVILANDPHIKFSSPSVWFEAHVEYPGFGFYGNFMAGIPVALVGHSRNHAWGVTMFEDDDSDFYVETFLNADSSATVYRDSLSQKVQKISETIVISGRADTTFTVYRTVHGPIVNQFLTVEDARPVSMSWGYTQNENQLLKAFYQMNHTSDMEGFEAGVKLIGSPGLNINYGDAAGNVAMWSAGRLIRRPETSNGKEYLDGSKWASENKGYYPFKENPKTVNPAVGYILSANQKHDTIEGVDYPGYYAPSTRYDRINHRIVEMSPMTVDSMKQLIFDNISETEMDVAQEMAGVIMNGGFVPSDDEQAGLDVLLAWNGSHNLDDIAPTLYYKLLYYSVKGAMIDELGADNFDSFLGTFAFKRAYPKLISNDAAAWWDNMTTTKIVEKRSQILSKALQRTIAELQSELGADMNEWQWSKVHFVVHEHPLGQVEMLSPWFNVGPFPAPGGNETINNASFRLNGEGKYQTVSGPSIRTIVDFADVENAISIQPTGNSGNIMSPHYQDQAEMFVNGEFRKMMMNKEEIISNSSLLLVLPSK